MSSNGRYLLAIESAIAGGSIALLDDSGVIAARCGHGSVSRAEDLLQIIVAMLDEARVSKNELSRVAVSLGPGSYTGVRIGISTAMGLKRGLNIGYVGVPLFEALSEVNPDTLIAVPMGKTDICFADSKAPGTSRVVSPDQFAGIVRTSGNSRIVVHPALTEKLESVPGIELLDANLASHIGRAAVKRSPSEKLEPIYVQNPRFG